MMRHKEFRFRAFVSLLTGFSFVALAITGVVLYITPPGRVANWTNWMFWGLTKHQWGALHICFSALFLIASVLHIWLNFKPLINYFVNKAQAASKFRVEWLLAIIVCGIVFAGTMKPFAPFSSLLNLNDRIKFSWEEPKQRAPVPHAELLTIEELAKKADIEMNMILNNLQSHKIEASAADVFGDLAAKHNISPNELYEMAVIAQIANSGLGAGQGGGGFGQKTLQVACDEMNLDMQKAIDILKAAEIEAAADKTIRQIADENGVHPSRIRQILENQ
jgi:hypothetical protein